MDDDKEYILTEDEPEHEDEILHQQVNIFYHVQFRFKVYLFAIDA